MTEKYFNNVRHDGDMPEHTVRMSAILAATELRREWLAARLGAPNADREALYAGLEFEASIAHRPRGRAT